MYKMSYFLKDDKQIRPPNECFLLLPWRAGVTLLEMIATVYILVQSLLSCCLPLSKGVGWSLEQGCWFLFGRPIHHFQSPSSSHASMRNTSPFFLSLPHPSTAFNPFFVGLDMEETYLKLIHFCLHTQSMRGSSRVETASLAEEGGIKYTCACFRNMCSLGNTADLLHKESSYRTTR